MNQRHVFSTPDLVTAQRAVQAARAAGMTEDHLSVIARSDIQVEAIPDRLSDPTTDMAPAAVRGAATGGTLGLIAGLAAVAFPPLGITVAGAGLLAAVGAAVGGWSAALVGSTVPNEVRRDFETEIEQGRILVVLDDTDDARIERARAAVLAAGARELGTSGGVAV